MALGVSGTGPYGQIRSLRQEIADCRYELSLVAQGMRRELGAARLKEIIAVNRSKIRQIKDTEKAKKKSL
ncbi:MAG TPA: hypothetical protein VHE10_00330 [Candidatus Paceibacterota bacterium]|nr:hypothetical protein [Candidatus Paceibacterota bacterium]